MRISEEQYYELIERVVHEGEPELSVGPLPSVAADVPIEWVAALTAQDARTAIARLWSPMAERLPRTYRALQERLRGVALLRTEDIPTSLVYFFSDGHDWLPYRGGPPLSEHEVASRSLPDEFLEFYRIHDGWVLYYSEDGGPLPSIGCLPLSNLWANVVWKLPPGDVSEQSSVAVYRDGDEMALAYDMSTSSALPLRCFGDGKVDVLLDMWAAIDREVAVRLEDLDLAAHADKSIGRIDFDLSNKTIHRYEQLVSRLSERRTMAAQLAGGGIYEQASDLLLNCALLEKRAAGRRDNVIEYYRNALRYWCACIDLGGEASPDVVLDWFGVAHALGDPATAHFIAALPTSIWADDSPEALQARALFCMYIGDLENASAFVEELLGVTFDGGSEPEPEAEVIASLLQGLSQQDAAAYERWRQKAVDVLCQDSANQRALLPWSLRLRGFDAVASRLRVSDRSFAAEDPARRPST